MSQPRDRELDDVKRVLRRLQHLDHQQIEPLPASLPIEQSAVDGRRGHLQPNPFILAVAVVATLTGVLMTLGVTLVGLLDQQRVTTSKLGEGNQPGPSPQPSADPIATVAAIGTTPTAPPLTTGMDITPRLEASSATTAPHVVVPAVWSAPAGHGTRLALVFEPAGEAHHHHVLVSGIEASAFITKGIEIIAGTWMLHAADLAEAMIVRQANAAEKTSVTIELRTDSGTVVSWHELILLGPSVTTSGPAPLPLMAALGADEASHLLLQARQLSSRGDHVNARLLLEHAADLGNAEATLELKGNPR